MSFDLTNTPSTFQAAMNGLFRLLLHKFILVFFDDVLIFSISEADHQQYLQTTLSLLSDHQFYAKVSKCSFGQTQIHFVGHVMTL